MQGVAVLGSTGSIGKSALSVLRRHRDRFEVVALTAGYEHYWSSRWSSNVVVSPAWVVSELGDPAIANDKLDYIAANLRHWFLDQRAWAGVEYLHGTRELRSGVHGSANRIQFAVQFNILD